MSDHEIEIPKEVREFMLDDAEETSLGHKNGANRQFRYGNLHIREYDDKFLVHTDNVDPRKDPFGHLVFDAQEVLIGLACAAVSGEKIRSYMLKNKKSKNTANLSGFLSSIIAGYIGYSVSKKIKEKIG